MSQSMFFSPVDVLSFLNSSTSIPGWTSTWVGSWLTKWPTLWAQSTMERNLMVSLFYDEQTQYPMTIYFTSTNCRQRVRLSSWDSPNVGSSQVQHENLEQVQQRKNRQDSGKKGEGDRLLFYMNLGQLYILGLWRIIIIKYPWYYLICCLLCLFYYVN